MPWINRSTDPETAHTCDTPSPDEVARSGKGDVWSCPECHRLYHVIEMDGIKYFIPMGWFRKKMYRLRNRGN